MGPLHVIRRIAFLDRHLEPQPLSESACARFERQALRLDQSASASYKARVDAQALEDLLRLLRSLLRLARRALAVHREQAQREGLVVRHAHLGRELLALAQQVEPLGRRPRDEAQPAAAERRAREI